MYIDIGLYLIIHSFKYTMEKNQQRKINLIREIYHLF